MLRFEDILDRVQTYQPDADLDLAVEGVSCAGCMSKIERGLSALPDVTLARVNLTDRRVALEWKGAALDPARFVLKQARHGSL